MNFTGILNDDAPGQANIWALVDVLLMQVFFLIMYVDLREDEGGTINRPAVDRTQPVNRRADPRDVTIKVTSDARYFVEGRREPVEPSELRRVLEAYRNDPRDVKVFLDADGDTPWKAVIRVQEACRDTGLPWQPLLRKAGGATP
jgi:biopolymer transport protein ExbD